MEKLAEQKRLDQKAKRLNLEGGRKSKICALKNKLVGWGIDVTYWRYTQFKIGDMLFVMRAEKSRYQLVARKKCEHCKATRDSWPIDNLLELGRVLANEHGWAYHACPPKLEPKKLASPTREQRAYRLLSELRELMFGNQIDPSHIDNWPPQ